MAKGFDTRQSTRGTFAFAPKQGRQTRNDVAASPSIGQSGNVGGVATGGGNVVMSQNPTLGGNAGANIPAFLDSVLEPVIKARQDERVRAGYAAATNGAALEDIAKQQPGLSTIFGPTDFQRGAQFFATQTAVNNWSTEQLENMATLRELPEEDLPRYLNEAAMSHMTGDVFADNAINAAILEKTATLIPVIAQARVEWQQTTLRRGAVANNIAAAGSYEALVRTYTTQPELAEGQTDPLAGQRVNEENVRLAKESFLSSFLPIDGMTPEAFAGSVEETARGLLAAGNLWAFNAMDEGGPNSLLFQTMDADGYATLKSAYNTAGKSAQARALMQVGPEYDLFRTKVQLGQIAPGDIRAGLEAFNTRITALSGYTEPFFDGEDMVKQTEDGVTDLIRRYEADETRAYNEYRDEVNRTADAAQRQQESEQQLAGVLAAATIGDLQAAGFAYGTDKVNLAMTAAIRTDPATTIPMLIMSHRNSSYVVPGAKDILRSQITANIAAGYDGESFQTAYRNWKTFERDEAGLAARAAYYGEYDNHFARLETLLGNGTGMTGTLAYAQTFGEAGALAGTQQPAAAPRGDVKEKLEAAVTQIGPDFIARQLGHRQTTSATTTIGRLAIGGAYMRMQADPNLSEEQALRMEVSALQADNRLEIIGRDAWANPTRGQSMQELTQVPQDRIGRVWERLVDDGLDRIGAEGRPYTVWRSGTGTTTRWVVSVTPRNGGDAEAFQIDVPMIARQDRTTERQDIERRRPGGQPRGPYQDRPSGIGSVDRR